VGAEGKAPKTQFIYVLELVPMERKINYALEQ
jgi:hypothetical protein